MMSIFKKIIFPVVILIIITGCKNGAIFGSAPSVKLIEPTNGTTGVTLSPTLKVQFDQVVKNVNTSNVSLHQGNETGNTIKIKDILSNTNNTYTINFVQKLDTNTTYYLVLNSGIVAAVNGKPLPKTAFNFKTSYINSTFSSLTAGNIVGSSPKLEFVGSDGDAYGFTSSGGKYSYGTILKIDETGKLSTIYSFSGGADGYSPSSLTHDTNGNLYGTTSSGGKYGFGTVFEINSQGTKKNIYSFQGSTDGSSPINIIIGNDTNIYGITQAGGVNDDGVLFKLEMNGNKTSLADFNNSITGSSPVKITETPNGNIYGTTNNGGPNTYGTIFEYQSGAGLSNVFNFAGPNQSTGCNPYSNRSSLFYADNFIYGTTYGCLIGGATGRGTVFKFNPANNQYSVLVNDLQRPSSVIKVGNILYGTSWYSGINGYGSVFKYDLNNNTENILYSFAGANSGDGWNPNNVLISNDGNTLVGSNGYGGLGGLGAIFTIKVNSNDYNSIYSFENTNDSLYSPNILFVSHSGINYGASLSGGANNAGGFFMVNNQGSLTNLFSYSSAGGSTSAITEDSESNIYIANQNGGTGAAGVIIKYNLITKVNSTIYNFSQNSNGWSPSALITGVDHNLYGLTLRSSGNNGRLFKYNLSTNQMSNVYTFPSDNLSGLFPNFLMQLPTGAFYGLTQQGGNNNQGVFFEFNNGNYTKIHDFSGSTDGYSPSSIAYDSNGNFYISASGGNYGLGAIYKITSTDTKSTLYSFKDILDGTNPTNLVIGSDGNLYGVTSSGGEFGYGTLFKITTAGIKSTVYSFAGTTNGSTPNSLALDPINGLIYGTTFSGGANFGGMIYYFK